MTKQKKLEEQTDTSTAPKKRRKLTKAEEEEYTREMNAIWAKISKAIQDGQIVLPEWRRNP